MIFLWRLMAFSDCMGVFLPFQLLWAGMSCSDFQDQATDKESTCGKQKLLDLCLAFIPALDGMNSSKKPKGQVLSHSSAAVIK